jgi:hypothetical protein
MRIGCGKIAERKIEAERRWKEAWKEKPGEGLKLKNQRSFADLSGTCPGDSFGSKVGYFSPPFHFQLTGVL